MTDFPALAEPLGLAPGELAHLLRTTPRTVQRWQRGEQPPNPLAEAVLRLASEVPAAREWLLRDAPVDGRKRPQDRRTAA